MKLFRSRPVFWAVVLSLGAVGGALRLGTFGPAMDEKGLILYTHPLVLGLLICTLPVFWAVVLSLGAVGGALRLGTFGPAMDEKGLILYTHPLVLGLLICTLIALALSLMLAGKSGGSNQFKDNFQPSRLAAVGHYILAVGIFSTA